jgi:hypothetical protein
MRHDSRADDELRPLRITRGYTRPPAGSVLVQAGRTTVLCVASISNQVPAWMAGRHETRHPSISPLHHRGAPAMFRGTLRILVVGIVAMGFGGYFFIQALWHPKDAIAGAIWKGPLIFSLGVVAFAIAARNLKALQSSDEKSSDPGISN